MKSILALSASLLVTASLVESSAQACTPAFFRDGLSAVTVVGKDTLPLDSGVVVTATIRNLADADVLPTLNLSVVDAKGAALAGKASVVKRQMGANSAESIVVQWMPDTPFARDQVVRVQVAHPDLPEQGRKSTHDLRVSETKLADLVAPEVTLAAVSFREVPDTTVPAASCKVAEGQPGMCDRGFAKGETIAFAPRLRNAAHFVIAVNPGVPTAVAPFIAYTVRGGGSLYSPDSQEISVGTTPAGSEFCAEVTATNIVDGSTKTGKVCATVPESPPVPEAAQSTYLDGATRLCEKGTIAPDDVAEEAEANTTGASSGEGCNASGHGAPAPIAGILAVASLVALRRRALRSKDEGARDD